LSNKIFIKIFSKKNLINYSLFFFSLLLLLLLLELASFLSLKFYKKDNIEFLISKNNLKLKKILNDPCNKMETHPILSHVHADGLKCKILNGSSYHFFSIYSKKLDPNKETIVTLGGSTTDGHYQGYAAGQTWPKQLNDKIDQKKYQVLNAGTGQYNSSQELSLLLHEIFNLGLNIKYVLVLNGENEMYNYPTDIQKTMFKSQRWVRQDILHDVYFPSLFRILRKIGDETTVGKTLFETDLENNSYSKRTVIDRDKTKAINGNLISKNWHLNVSLMNEISKFNGATLMVFLQPTMGLENISSKPKKNSNDEKIYSELLRKEKNYISIINNYYPSLKKICSLYSFCFDLTELPLTDHYHDPRHPNKDGNKLIADEIYSRLNYYLDQSK
jgi:hypothetical protein